MWRKIQHVNANQKEAGVTKLVSDEADFKARKLFKDKEGHCMTVKGSVLQEDPILDKCAPNSRVSNRVTTMARTAVREGGSP